MQTQTPPSTGTALTARRLSRVRAQVRALRLWIAAVVLMACGVCGVSFEAKSRTELFYNEMNNSQHLTDLYQLLLESRPTWPYFYSGLAQVDQVNKQLQFTHINKAMSFGAHERKVVNSLAEILFYNWDSLEVMSRNRILDYLSNQPSWSIAQSINISAKFSRVYEYCDFLYEKKQVEYATCKHHYWQPLTGV